MTGFVIKYHRRTGELQVEEFEDLRSATLRRVELEKATKDDDVEIVALVGRSLEAIQSSHSRYFASA